MKPAIANIIVWPKSFERFRPVILGARYVAVSGEVQQESGVIHVVAWRIEDLTALLARLTEDAPPDRGAGACRRGQAPARRGRRQPRPRPPQSAAHRGARRASRSAGQRPRRAGARLGACALAPRRHEDRSSLNSNRELRVANRATNHLAIRHSLFAFFYGSMPSRPTFTRSAPKVPSGCFVALTIMILAPGLSSSLLPTM